jgi:hypothetical protein
MLPELSLNKIENMDVTPAVAKDTYETDDAVTDADAGTTDMIPLSQVLPLTEIA